MKNRLIIYVSAAILLTAICFLITSSFIISGIVLLLAITSSLFLIEPLISTQITKNRKGNEAYHFINSFIISLSASKSLELSYENAVMSLNEDEKKTLKSIEDHPIDEKLNYLGKYFETDIYKVFLSTMKLYEEEGGDILDVAAPLLRESAAIEEERISHQKNITKAVFQFSSLWAMSLLVMGILRFSLSTFYNILKGNTAFLALVTFYFLLAIVSFTIFASIVTDEKISIKRRAKE